MTGKFQGLLFILFFIFTSANTDAQKIQLGFKAGLSLPNLSSGGFDSAGVSSGYHSISGPDFAIFGDYKLNEKLSIEAGMEWSTQGGEKSGLQTIPASDFSQLFPPGTDIQYVYANFTGNVRLQYLMFPLQVKYRLNLGDESNWYVYAEGGIFGAYLVNAKASAYGTSKIYYDPEETMPLSQVEVSFDSTGNIRSELHRGNFGVVANLGILYQMNDLSFFAEAGGNYGFINLQKDVQNGVNHTGALVFRAGVMFSLGYKANPYY